MKDLKSRLYTEGISKKEFLNLNEAPIDYEGTERMEPGIERKITGK